MIKFQRILMACFILLVPIIWPLTNAMDVRNFQESVFQYAAMGLCCYFVGNLWLGLFMTWTLILFYWNGGQIGHETVLNIFLGIMIFGISRKFFKNFRFEKEAKWIGWLGAVTILFMYLQLFGVDPIHVSRNDAGLLPHEQLTDLIGIFNLKAHNGIFLALFACYMAYLSLPIGLLALCLVGTSLSSGAVMAGIAGILFYTFWTRKKWFKWILIVCLLGGILFTIKDVCFDKKMYGSRFNMWHAVVKSCCGKPLGYGPDSFGQETPNKPFLFGGDEDSRCAMLLKVPGSDEAFQFVYYDPNPKKMFNDYNGLQPKQPHIWRHPHNEYLFLLFCFGIPGVVLLYLLIKEMVFLFRRVEKTEEIILITSMLIVYAAGSMTQFPVCVARLGYLLPVILGAFYANCGAD